MVYDIYGIPYDKYAHLNFILKHEYIDLISGQPVLKTIFTNKYIEYKLFYTYLN